MIYGQITKTNMVIALCFFVKSVEVAEALISAGADVRCRNKLGETSLHYARSLGIVNLFLEAGADVNAASHAGRLPLQSVFHQDVAVALVEGGAEVNIFIDRRKNEFLCQAKALGWPDLARVINEKLLNTNLREVAMPSSPVVMARVQIPQSLRKRPAEAVELGRNQTKFSR